MGEIIMANEPTYLGDGVYATFDGYQVKLFLHNGVHEYNPIYLEPAVIKAFERYVADLIAKLKAEDEKLSG
jgi:hypothetical protein